MKTAILASLVAAASAFAPANNVAQTSVAVNAASDFEGELGVQQPLGFYDPLKILQTASQERFDRLRYIELKHGRISMLAVVGYLWTYAGNRLDGNIDFSGRTFNDIGYGFKAIEDIGPAAFGQIFFFCGFLEFFVMKDATGENEFIGDFRNGLIDFGWDKFSDEDKYRKRGIELNQGRAAMMGILGLMVHEQLGVPILPGN